MQIISINIPVFPLGAPKICGENLDLEFQKLYSAMYLKLVRQVAFLLGDLSMAEDIAQEAFIRLRRTGIDIIDNPPAWLTKVVHNLCYDHMRSEGSRRRREEKVFQPADISSTFAASAEEAVLGNEELQMVHKALEKLQARDRMVLLMKFSGYSYEEIAVTVDINKSSVGTILARARERFKREYELIM